MILGMGTHLVIEWSVPEAHGEQTERAMLAVRDHVLAEHPEVRAVRLVRQFAGPLPHVAYRWEEEYDDLTAIDELTDTPECAAVWVPVNALAVPGSHRQSIWADTGVTPPAVPGRPVC
jgi:hypothetical protein